MAKTARRDGPSSRQLGRHLKQIRRKQGLSRAEVARSAGLTRRELGAYERGSVDVPESDLWCLAGSCGVDVSELLPRRDPLEVSADLSSLAVGDSIRHLRGPSEPDGMLREYLAMIYELRNLPPGSRVPLREPDLVALADALGGTPDAIEQKLVELIGASRDEAARLRAMILPPLSLPAPFERAPSNDPYATLGAPGSADGVVDFFSAPRAEDPFAPPPPLTADAASASVSFDVLPPDPFAPPPSSQPIDAGPAPTDPGLLAPLVDPFAPPREAEPAEPSEPSPVELAPPAPPAPVEPAAATPWGESLATWGPERELPDGLVVDHGTPEPPPTPVDPFDAPEPTFAPYVPTPDASGSNGNGHHDATGLVDVDTASPDDEVALMDANTAPDDEVALMDADTAPDDSPDGFISDTPELAASTLFDGPDLDDVINDMVGNPTTDPARDVEPAAALREPASLEPAPDEPAPPEPALSEPAPPEPAPLDAMSLESPLLERPDPVEPPLPGDDPTPISWTAHEAPAAPARCFEQVGANWRVGGSAAATATADDGALAIRRADARWALADIDAPGDFTIDTTVDFTAGTGFGVLFRAVADDAERVSGYSFDVDSVAGGGGYLLRQWEDNRQHWRPLAHAPVADPSTLYGRRSVQIMVRGDHLEAVVDGETVLSVPGLSRASVALGRTPSRGSAVGVQAAATTELTVDTFRIAR